MNKRLFLAILLCTLVMIVYMSIMQALYPRRPPHQTSPKTPSTEAPKQTPQAVQPAKALAVLPGYVTPKFTPAEKTIETSKFRAQFSNKGASLLSLTVKEYNDSTKHNSKLELLMPPADNARPFGLTLFDPQSKTYLEPNLNEVTWEMTSPNPNTLEFRYPLPNGLEVKKIFTFAENDYPIKARLILSNKATSSDSTSSPIKIAFEGTAFAGMNSDGTYRTISYLQGYVGKMAEEAWAISYVNLQQLEAAPEVLAPTAQIKQHWCGIKNRYFAALMIPDPTLIDTYVFSRQLPPKVVEPAKAGEPPKAPETPSILCRFRTPELTVAREDRIYDFTYYVGPIKLSELEKVGKGVPDILSYSGFAFIGFTILWVLNFFYVISRNYGIAIIFTTMVVRLLLFPLSKKNQVSMYKMQKLQPKLKALQEKYKNDRQRVAQEQMKMYKEYGVNPLGGCLPLLLQLPIFFGMYSVLDISIDLRMSSFLWIGDLTQPDHLGKLPFSILGATELNILPIAMCATMLIQSALQPVSADPQQRMQQKMMMFMGPAMIGLFCYNLASGLSLYWFVSSLLGIFEQRLIRKVYLKV